MGGLRLAGAAKTTRRRSNLARDDLIQIEGTVEAVKGAGFFEIKTDMGPTITAKLSGRMRRYRIRVVPGDRVTVGVSPYDATRGLIVYRAR